MKEIERTHYELGRLVGHLQSYASKIDSITEHGCRHADGRIVQQNIVISMKHFNEEGEWFVGEEHLLNRQAVAKLSPKKMTESERMAADGGFGKGAA